LQFSSTKSIDKKTSYARYIKIYSEIYTSVCSKILQVNYNQVVVKCQISQECFLQNFKMQKLQNIEHSNPKNFTRTSQEPHEP